MPINIGQAAPGFTLFDTEKKKVSLHDFQGRNVVVLFFPFAFSGVCTKEMCAMEDNHSFYSNLNTAILGISVDSVYSNSKLKEVYKLSFALLSDFNKEVSAAYDSLYDDFGSLGYRGVSKRATFLVDGGGRIAYFEILPSAGDFPNLQKLQQAVLDLKQSKTV